ncbi:MAG: phosphoglucosamine mutase [marine bacterium B5-7]|nr:MAG: phosphoglucosamine mutase [marine bacterium B5-7]
MTRKYFGTDGIRGTVGCEPITPGGVLKLGWAAGRILCRNSENPKVVIGKDTRVSGYLLESALEAGFSAAGVNVLLIGPMPTPGIAYLTRTARADAGIVISASHNPFEDNGIKFFSGAGTKIDDDIELEIERMMDMPLVTVESRSLGKAERFSDAAGRYIEFCKSTFPANLSLKGLRVVVDCANGAAYHIAPHVFEELGADVVAICNEPNGFNINLECGSIFPDKLRETVRAQDADIGVALDGDGDRMVLVDRHGMIVDGDQALFVMMIRRHKIGSLNGGVAGTLMTNFGFERACEHHGIEFQRAAVGDRYVIQALRERGWLLGGETSGHIISLDKSTTGDGIIAALEVMAAIVESGQPLDQLVAGMERFPQVMINVRLMPGTASAAEIIRSSEVVDAVDDVNRELGTEGRVVLRPSGTEPLIRVMVEGREPDVVERLAGLIAKAVTEASQLRSH